MKDHEILLDCAREAVKSLRSMHHIQTAHKCAVADEIKAAVGAWGDRLVTLNEAVNAIDKAVDEAWELDRWEEAKSHAQAIARIFTSKARKLTTWGTPC